VNPNPTRTVAHCEPHPHPQCRGKESVQKLAARGNHKANEALPTVMGRTRENIQGRREEDEEEPLDEEGDEQEEADVVVSMEGMARLARPGGDVSIPLGVGITEVTERLNAAREATRRALQAHIRMLLSNYIVTPSRRRPLLIHLHSNYIVTVHCRPISAPGFNPILTLVSRWFCNAG